MLPKIALLFPGQGTQTVGMAKALIKEFSPTAYMFRRASWTLGYNLEEMCTNGSEEQISSTEISQPAIFTYSLAAIEYLRVRRTEMVRWCTAAAGLSLGEYTALTFAGALSFSDGVSLVKQRAIAMQEASDAAPGGMVSILGKSLEEVEKLCDENRGDGVLQVANILCPGNIVVSGSLDACERIAELASKKKFQAIPLAVSGAFHTSLMQPAVARLVEALNKVEIKEPEFPVISNVDAKPHTDPDEIRQLLIKQIVSPVLWEDSMRYLLAQGFEIFYEIGHGRVLRSLMKRIDREAPCFGSPK
ncbi:MAG: ACP S-malonyltransferase [Planctomycetaceae bacterium]|jgi:[acyl-carrier-protein] S-malonyltransferase|nr:ACP S-malonyltransferase [Planctomycetaceae bacterium]